MSFLTLYKTALAALAGLMLFGCSSPSVFTRVVHQDPSGFVSLESPLGGGTARITPYRHPVQFTKQEMAAVLQSVGAQREMSSIRYYVLRQDPKSEPVFTPQEIQLLNPRLVAAFSKARPEEVVVFFLNQPRQDSVLEITSGGLFVQDERLYFLLANLRAPVTTASKAERAREHPLSPLSEPDFEMKAGAHQVVLETKSTVLPPWAGAVKGVAIAYRDLETTGSLLSTPGDSIKPPPSSPTVDNKLRQLKLWKEQGIISEHDYQEQKRKILDTY
ncbi:MAG: hypothetical protein HY284_05145 [Nitrospirae bacterium]|nr:hypothetical protein [Nitrospirota bacterium]